VVSVKTTRALMQAAAGGDAGDASADESASEGAEAAE